jgi:hypothetical protein
VLYPRPVVPSHALTHSLAPSLRAILMHPFSLRLALSGPPALVLSPHLVMPPPEAMTTRHMQRRRWRYDTCSNDDDGRACPSHHPFPLDQSPWACRALISICLSCLFLTFDHFNPFCTYLIFPMDSLSDFFYFYPLRRPVSSVKSAIKAGFKKSSGLGRLSQARTYSPLDH